MSSLRLEEYAFRITENYLRLSEVIEGCSWQIDMATELLTFYIPKSQKVIAQCPAQLVGSENDADQTWLWAWANEESNLPPGMLEAVNRLRRTAESQGQSEPYLTGEEFALPRPSFGAEMAVICAGISSGFTTYRCPYPGGAAYAIVESCPPAAQLPSDIMRTIRTLTTGVSAFPMNHRDAVRAYLGEPDADDVFAPGIKVVFDDLDRIADIQARLSSENVSPPPSKSPLDRLKRLFGG
jgi:hypothetical protein